MGKPSLFIRLPLCNLNCRWCDTKYALSDNDLKKTSLQLIKTTLSNIVITGGEPFLNLTSLILLYNHFNKGDVEFEVLTNGTLVSEVITSKPNITFNISPKMSNAKITKPYDNSVLIKHLQSINNDNYIVKFVVSELKDMEEVLLYVKDNNVPRNKVYIMPEGITREDQLLKSLKIVDICMKYNFNFTPRLHILVWNTKRGV